MSSALCATFAGVLTFAPLRDFFSVSSGSHRAASCFRVAHVLDTPPVTETLRRIAGNRLAVAEPGGIE
jgi:hypothetical protein